MNELITLMTYFFIYAFIGWVLESVYKSLLQKKIINSGFLEGPICPIYGYGALIMYLSLRNVTDNIIVLFLFGLVILSLFEYVVGLFLEIVFKTKYWDYSERKFNIQGRVCLLNSTYWGILGIVFMKGIHPLVEDLVKAIPKNYVKIFAITAFILMVIDTVATLIKLAKINSKLKSWEKLTTSIHSRIETINLNNAAKMAKFKNLTSVGKNKILGKIKDSEDMLGNLRFKQQEMQSKLEKKINRLRKAFPTMKSERLSKFLNNVKKS